MRRKNPSVPEGLYAALLSCLGHGVIAALGTPSRSCANRIELESVSHQRLEVGAFGCATECVRAAKITVEAAPDCQFSLKAALPDVGSMRTCNLGESRAMAHNQIMFESTSRQKILRGARQPADAARTTLGPQV